MRTLIDELKQSEYLPATLSAIAGCRADIQSSTAKTEQKSKYCFSSVQKHDSLIYS